LPRPKFVSISIKDDFAEAIETFIDQHPTLGYRSIAQFLEDSARRRLEEIQSQIKELPRFEKINSDENGVKILDRKIHRVVDIYFKPNGAKCSLDQTDVCEHIDFALTQKDVKEIIRNRRREGWKLPDV